jgi:hypothetical protein
MRTGREAVVQGATTDVWDKYYERAKERRALQGGDPLRRYLHHHIARERCLMAGACLFLVGLVTTFCAMLMS